MKVGVHVANFEWPAGPTEIAGTLSDIARAAEDSGCQDLTVMDHFFQLEGFAPAEGPMLEGYTTLGYLAAVTSRIELGLLVTGVTYRYPGLLAKTVGTLDVLSGGRARLGIGAAWYEREHRGLGVPFPPLAERFERLEEALLICIQMWEGGDGSFTGQHFQLAETLNSPAPLRRPPIMIGGSGERKTLRLVARYADACNLFAASVDEVRHKLEVLAGHCDAEGTDFDRIAKTILYMGTSPLDDPRSFLESMSEMAGAGIDEVYVMPLDPDPVAFAAGLGKEIVPELSGM